MKTQRRNPLGSKTRGFSLLETIVAAGLVGLIAMIAATYMGNITDGANYERGRSMQESIVERLRLAAGSQEAIRDSVFNAMVGSSNAGNIALRDCLDRSRPCIVTSAKNQVGFNLWMSTGSVKERIAGPPDNPVAYDDKGQRDCDRGRRNCFFGAEAYWWATCPDGGPSCAVPDTIHVRVRTIPINKPARGAEYKPYPSNFDTDKTSGAIAIRAADINKKRTNDCRPNEKQIGFDAQGFPVCRCVVPPVAKPGVPLQDPPPGGCDAQECPTYVDSTAGINVQVRMVLVGYNADGTLRCVKPDQNETCWNVRLRDGGDCGPGAWMMRVVYGKCESEDPDKSGKGGSRDVVSCTNDLGTCCKQSL